MEALSIYGSRSVVVAPEGVSRASKRILEELGVSGVFAGVVDRSLEPAMLVVVDTANPAQLSPYEWLLEQAIEVVVIDHHMEGTIRDIADTALVIPEAASTSEIVAFSGSLLRIPFSPVTASALLAGILFDTRNLRITGPFTAEALGYLLDMGADQGLVARVARETRERDTSERIALLKAMSRLRFARACRDILIAVTHVGSFESSVARALLDIGADVAVVAKDTREGVRVSVRTSPRAEGAGITALDIARYIGEKLGGEAGGHPSAAGVSIRSQTLTAEEVAGRLAVSLPGKVARLCTAVTKGEEARGEA
ncbi:MAG: DHHA1 domain-containing protein [Desulfurococcales archaeon]|nr:DHHA1 domain-containing protein [Desulfurococcales archaeon]